MQLFCFGFFSNLLPQDSSVVLAKLHHENEYGRKRRSEEKLSEEVVVIFFSLEYNCSTLLCYSLQYKEVNQLLHLGPPSQPTPIPPPRSTLSLELSSLCYTVDSH